MAFSCGAALLAALQEASGEQAALEAAMRDARGEADAARSRAEAADARARGLEDGTPPERCAKDPVWR